MEQTEIQEGNKLIAEFMGIKTKIYRDTPTVTYWSYENSMKLISDMEYYSSWDWLMPVVEKIKSLRFDWPTATDSVLSLCVGVERHVLYTEVIEFIKWYNQNK